MTSSFRAETRQCPARRKPEKVRAIVAECRGKLAASEDGSRRAFVWHEPADARPTTKIAVQTGLIARIGKSLLPGKGSAILETDDARCRS
jgi:hypothetical protein